MIKYLILELIPVPGIDSITVQKSIFAGIWIGIGILKIRFQNRFQSRNHNISIANGLRFNFDSVTCVNLGVNYPLRAFSQCRTRESQAKTGACKDKTRAKIISFESGPWRSGRGRDCLDDGERPGGDGEFPSGGNCIKIGLPGKLILR